MKILVCSDSHGDYPLLFRAHDAAGPVDLTIHLGDGSQDARLLEDVLHVPVLRVAGNCDHDSVLPRELLIELEGAKVFATHGHAYGVKGGLSGVVARGAALGAAVVLFGHTHRPLLEHIDGILLLNPGALAGRESFALLTLCAGLSPEAEILTVSHPEPGA